MIENALTSEKMPTNLPKRSNLNLNTSHLNTTPDKPGQSYTDRISWDYFAGWLFLIV